jgi:hypothetical protein
MPDANLDVGLINGTTDPVDRQHSLGFVTSFPILLVRVHRGFVDPVCNSVQETGSNYSGLGAKPLRDNDSDAVRATIFPKIPCFAPVTVSAGTQFATDCQQLSRAHR